MTTHRIVSHDDWMKASKALLAREKEFTRQRDELAQARRELPWEKVEKTYVFDAPEGSDGQSAVSAKANGDRCTITIAAGSGFAGHPLLFTVGTAHDGCAVSASTDVPAGAPPPGGGVTPTGQGGATAGRGRSGQGNGCGEENRRDPRAGRRRARWEGAGAPGRGGRLEVPQRSLSKPRPGPRRSHHYGGRDAG